MGKKANNLDQSLGAVPAANPVPAKKKAVAAKPVSGDGVRPIPAIPRTRIADKRVAKAASPRTPATTKSPRFKDGADGNGAGYTENEVALRAYFISENRRAAGLPGDPQSDWIEAERQLRAEAKAGK